MIMCLNITKTFPIIIKSHLDTLNAYFGVQNDKVRTRSRLGNSNGNQQPKTQRVIEHASEFMPLAELITMAGVQAMIREMLDEQMEKTI